MHYRKILLASHLTPNSDPLAKKAHTLAEENQAELHIIHAIENFPVFAYGYIAIDEIEKSILAEAQKRIKAMGRQLHLPDTTLHIVHQPSKIAILEVAKQIEADLIMIGSHGNNGIFSSLGSTASAVVNGALCDVLVIRHDER